MDARVSGEKHINEMIHIHNALQVWMNISC